MTRTIIASLAVGVLTAGCSVFGAQTVETPDYQMLAQSDDIEVRRYPALILAETAMGESEGEAFRRLFRYITGENDGGREIAMTAPVIMDDGDAAGREIAMTAPVVMGEGSMAFITPADVAAAGAPRPTDPAIRLVETPERTMAAIRFTGFLSESSAQEEEEALRAWIAESDWRPTGPAARAGYNPPWTLPFLRRNEVLIPVAPRTEMADQASGSGVTAR